MSLQCMFLLRKAAGTMQDQPTVSRGLLRKQTMQANKQLKVDARKKRRDTEKARVSAQPPLSHVNLAAVRLSHKDTF